jgi:hypothetical protein
MFCVWFVHVTPKVKKMKELDAQTTQLKNDLTKANMAIYAGNQGTLGGINVMCSVS